MTHCSNLAIGDRVFARCPSKPMNGILFTVVEIAGRGVRVTRTIPGQRVVETWLPWSEVEPFNKPAVGGLS